MLEITWKYFDVGEVTSHIICSPLHELSKKQSCHFCGAKHFQYEPSRFCCYNGQVVISTPQVPKDLYNLYISQSEEALEFCQHIRANNSIFSFTSCGVKLDKKRASSWKGVYTFRAQGQIYNDLPSLVPSNDFPCFFQLYFYDTDNEVQNRLQVLKDVALREIIVQQLMRILLENLYTQFFHRLENPPLNAFEIHI